MCVFFKHQEIEKVRLSNMKWSYSRHDFQRVYGILEDLDWIRPREAQLQELFYELLKIERERVFIEALLRKVVYLDDNDSRARAKEIAAVITEEWKCQEDETVIVGAKKRDSSDGGDILIYNLRNCLKWKEGRIRTTYKELSTIPNVKAIIIADDFIGSGKRMHDVIEDIKKIMPGVPISFVSIGLMESIVRKYYADVLNYHYYAPVILSPGFDHRKENEVNMMTQIESYLAKRWDNKSLEQYHLGFKQSGALFWNRQLRVPNNVYPVFWWGAKADGSPFNSIMGEQ